MVIFLFNLHFFVWIQHGCLANTGYAMDPRPDGFYELKIPVMMKTKNSVINSYQF